MVFTDVVPIRPYTAVFQTDFQPLRMFSQSHPLIGDLFGAVLIIILASSLFGTVANFTTGRVISHSGFTPNPNVTSSIGMVPIVQLIPFIFGSMVLLMTYALFERHLPGGL